MGGNSSSRHVSLDDEADEVTFVKGIRLSERVIERMKESPPVVRPQAPTRSFMQSPSTPPVAPPVECSFPDERHVPIMPHSPSYASALVPPPISKPITPLVPLVTEETSTPPSSVDSPTGNKHVVVPDPQPGSANILVPDPQPGSANVLVPDPQPGSANVLVPDPQPGSANVLVPDPQPGSANILTPDPQPAEPINAPSRVSSEPLTAPSLEEPTSAPVEPLIPPPVATSTTEPVTIPPSPTTDPLTGPVTSLESSVVPVVVPTELLVPTAEPIEPVETPSSSTLSAEPTSADPMDIPVPSPVELETSPFPISIPDPIPSILEESTVSPSGSASDEVSPDEMPSKTQMDPPSTEEVPPVEEPVVPPLIDQVEVFQPQTHVVNEEMLRKQIREDLQKLLNEEMKTAERNMLQQLEEEKAKAKAQAQAAAQLQIQEEVQKVLEEEKVSYQQTLADAIRREQVNVQDERLITQYYWMERKAQKLDEKEKDLKNQDTLFREQIAKMQEKAAQFTKVTAENYRKGLEDATNRFRRYQIQPVCLDLQSQIMKCYAENKGQTMSCSNIASLYIQCVDRAKQDKKLSTGG
ncbi:coiled-coil-helix-coiled-coil-helix domain containing 3b isoform X1 [Megalobrama amblycephala]|uniref:coiled-coil-helix-coiled-coil-helix domain containing 3b isoform X1 n=1 Tax=Megalobrama amblycephala TaxID=75352 RepID=UPI002013FF95|nr:coiled-coil-helix-coiled-coil-helix domain containing 3b isoform X1 [Megalobrama amblycephala]